MFTSKKRIGTIILAVVVLAVIVSGITLYASYCERNRVLSYEEEWDLANKDAIEELAKNPETARIASFMKSLEAERSHDAKTRKFADKVYEVCDGDLFVPAFVMGWADLHTGTRFLGRYYDEKMYIGDYLDIVRVASQDWAKNEKNYYEDMGSFISYLNSLVS